MTRTLEAYFSSHFIHHILLFTAVMNILELDFTYRKPLKPEGFELVSLYMLVTLSLSWPLFCKGLVRKPIFSVLHNSGLYQIPSIHHPMHNFTARVMQPSPNLHVLALAFSN